MAMRASLRHAAITGCSGATAKRHLRIEGSAGRGALEGAHGAGSANVATPQSRSARLRWRACVRREPAETVDKPLRNGDLSDSAAELVD